ncbi:MAG: MotA/TolQ/ExbB proton channel family protein [Verrucomicrobiaceae bacterium]|nr:MotA/TolQ/ExbB proton channel family protein [Verrucomicrobiaceae bacterium]
MTFSSTDLLLAEGSPGGFQLVWDFLSTGGFVMALIVLCSMASVACIIIAALHLRESVLLPVPVVAQLKSLSQYAAKGDIGPLQQFLERDGSLLARLGYMAISGQFTSKQDCTEVVGARAKEELNRLERGIPYLEVMVTVAPLLGLLGTTIGLVGMFTAFGDASDASGGDTGVIAREIGVALRCTIAGLFVAVPSVVAHTIFVRKIDTIAVRLETLLQEVIQGFYQYFEVSRS